LSVYGKDWIEYADCKLTVKDNAAKDIESLFFSVFMGKNNSNLKGQRQQSV
jgi:hypothetical protein